ncbi:MAG: FG-GAP-like repeat-containing protein [Gammaproteobacteria bacterium]|nr:FG-GAP-like repeat-containing protein [Gammaproteobacteria bacterium]
MKSWPLPTFDKVRLVIIILVIGILFLTMLSLKKYLTDITPDWESGYSINPASIFTDNTLQAGIRFSHLQGDSKLTGLDETLGSGACAFDYNNDGWVDLFIVNGSGQTRFYGKQYWWQQNRSHALYKNIGNGKFKDVTVEAGLTERSWGMGCATADLDNDGYSDLLVTNNGINKLYKNNNGFFTDITAQSGISGTAWSTSAAVADYDGDGLLDIYIANYLKFVKGANTFESDNQFDGSIPGTFNSSLYDAQDNRLYRNLGNMKFEDITTISQTANTGGRSLGVIWLDANNDSLPDLFVINDKNGTPNTLYLNRNGNKFEKTNLLSGISSSLGHMGVATGDIENDGDIDLVIGSDNQHSHLLLINNTLPAKLTTDDSTTGMFKDLSRKLKLSNEQSTAFVGWNPGLQDFNNDGWLDCFMANGLVVPDPDVKKIPLGQSKQIWINQGKGYFKDVTNISGPALLDTQSARGAAFADFDNDGDIDVYVTHNNDLGQMLINQSPPGNWLNVTLESTESNRDSIGAKLTLTTRFGKIYKTVNSGGGFMSGNDRRIHFGLGKDNHIKSLSINWPDGTTSDINNIAHNQFIKIKQGFGILPNQAAPVTHSGKISSVHPQAFSHIKIPDNKKLYLNWLVKQQDINNAIDVLELATQDNNDSVREESVRLLGEYRHDQSLILITRALSDSSTKVRVAAIMALKQLETEISSRWMLRTFNDPDADVRIAVANAYAFFYREEEALVHRKYLALPHLIKLLKDTSPKVRIAAAKALGESEKYRAVLPLINRLNDENLEVKTTTINSLGLLRERTAIPALLQLLDNTDQAPQILAQVLIALKRLEYPKLNQLIDKTIYSSNNPTRALQTIIAIFNDEINGVVLNKEMLADKLKHLYQTKAKLFDIETLQMITQSDYLNRRQFIVLLDELTKHSNPSIREQAYVRLITNNGKYRKKYIMRGLNDTSSSVRQRIIQLASDTDVTLPFNTIKKYLDHKNTSLPALKLIAKHDNHESLNILYNRALSNKTPVKENILALQLLSELRTAKITLPEHTLNHTDPKVQANAVHYWLQKSQSNSSTKNNLSRIKQYLQSNHHTVRDVVINFLLTIKETWAIRLLKETLLNSENEIIRRNIMSKLHISKNTWSLPVLIKISANPNDVLRIEALKLISHFNNTASNKFISKFVTSPDETETIRFLSAEAILNNGGSNILQLLNEGLISSTIKGAPTL